MLNEIFPTKRKYTIELTPNYALLILGMDKYKLNISNSTLFKDFTKKLKNVTDLPQRNYYGDCFYFEFKNGDIWKKNKHINDSKKYQDIYSEESYYFDYIMNILFKKYLTYI